MNQKSRKPGTSSVEKEFFSHQTKMDEVLDVVESFVKNKNKRKRKFKNIDKKIAKSLDLRKTKMVNVKRTRGSIY